MSEQPSESKRREAIEWAMSVVLEEVYARRLLPLVLLAGDGKTIVVLPCGPGADPADVARMLRDAAEFIEREART